MGAHTSITFKEYAPQICLQAKLMEEFSQLIVSICKNKFMCLCQYLINLNREGVIETLIESYNNAME